MTSTGMEDKKSSDIDLSDFASRIDFELKRAERYRIFVSLVILNVNPALEMTGDGKDADKVKSDILKALGDIIKKSIREIDAVSHSTSRNKLGLLFPETSRQGAEAAARRLTDTLNQFCADYFRKPAEYLIPVEISSFPDAAGARSINSYLDEFSKEK
ncbi:MAG: hypothetical protein NTV06_03670 [candidate division Zixibacteria bacterium]|nr:hypothetical protein [candidate division Zixibacteria bacterium]